MQPDYNNQIPPAPPGQIPGIPSGPYPQQPLPPPMQPMSASQLNKRSLNILLIPLIVAVVFLIGSLTFGFWAFSQRSELKNDVDGKIEAASAKAVEEAEKAKEADFAEREKQPLRTYQGPPEFGEVKIQYPKTWSAYVDEKQKGATPIDGYFHPSFVPGLKSDAPFALHVEVLEIDYPQELKKFDSASKSGKVKVTPIQAKNVAVTGARIDGEIGRDKRGSIVLFQMRDKTLKLTAGSEQFIKDFDKIILEKLTFKP